MATDSKNGFGPHGISFQSGAVNCTPEMISMWSYLGATASTAGSVSFGNSDVNVVNPTSRVFQATNSSASSLDSAPGIKHVAGLVVEWSALEQHKLEEGLENFKDEPGVMKYVKIAATLPEKSVRDVVLRCKWMTRKRRKWEEHDKKVTSRKDKLAESLPKLNMPSDLPKHSEMYHPFGDHMVRNTGMHYEGLDGTSLHLLQQNAQAFNQISSNLSMCRLQENIDLFRRTRNNITAVLDNTRTMPGVMSQMLPLPVSINQDLVNCIMQGMSQREARRNL